VAAPVVAPVVAPTAAKLKRCPTCDQQFSWENAFCPEHGVVLVALDAVAGEPRAPTAPKSRGRSDDLNRTRIAGSTDATQTPQAPVASPAASPPVSPTLRCPICGKTYGPGNIFCGEDGSRLEGV
jgi:hypothetical protein